MDIEIGNVENVNVNVGDEDLEFEAGTQTRVIGEATNYEDLKNLPQINNVTLTGNKSLNDLGIQEKGDYALTTDIPVNISELENDVGYITSYTETDPVFAESTAATITSTDVSNWNAKANTSDIPTNVSELTNDAGYITGFTETDPVFSASASAGITSSDINNWDAKQETLVSGTNIKTINNLSLLGSGNIDIQGGGGGTSDYDQLSNRPQINSVTLTGNKSLNDLGIQPAGNYLTSESDPIFVASAAYGITSSDITNWNNKSDFSGSYNDLTDTPTIPDELSDLSDDSTHRLVTDSDKTTWNGKYSLPSGGIPKTDLASGVQTSLGLADSALQSITSSDVTTALGYTPYNSTNPNGYTSNTGTITSVKMNGATISSSGEADLGTVITSHQNIKTINSTSMVGTGDVSVQPTLVSGTNIKTINNESLLGSGNITISSGTSTDVQVNGTSITSGGVANLVTNTAYNASSNKIATMSDVPSVPVTDVQIDGSSVVSGGVATIPSAGVYTSGVIKVSSAYYGLDMSDAGYLRGVALTYAQYSSARTDSLVSKGTLDNVIAEAITTALNTPV